MAVVGEAGDVLLVVLLVVGRLVSCGEGVDAARPRG